MDFDDLIRKGRNGESYTRDELVFMLHYPADSRESYRLMAEANSISKGLSENEAEVHAQLALNIGPCPANCAFCAFARINGLFKKEMRLTPEQAVAYAKQFEIDGANAIFVMTTADYPFEQFIEISQEIRHHLRQETIMIANVGDQSLIRAQSIKDAGFTGVYHALRLREGIDTRLSPKAREESIQNFQQAGLRVGTCVEPVGLEHTNEELARAILFTASFSPSFSGAARRIAIPGTEIASRGMITELRMAQIVAVTRLGVPGTIRGNCTHEPCTLGGMAGANLFWAEVGGNPRDIMEKTEEGRGETVASCQGLFHESGWGLRSGPSRFYGSSGQDGSA
jgi:biotin synthase